jgi:hypothetical protein
LGINSLGIGNRSPDSIPNGTLVAGDVVSWTVENLGPGESEVIGLRPQVTTNAANAPDGMLMQYETEVRPVNDVPLWTSDTARVFGP